MHKKIKAIFKLSELSSRLKMVLYLLLDDDDMSLVYFMCHFPCSVFYERAGDRSQVKETARRHCLNGFLIYATFRRQRLALMRWVGGGGGGVDVALSLPQWS